MVCLLLLLFLFKKNVFPAFPLSDNLSIILWQQLDFGWFSNEVFFFVTLLGFLFPTSRMRTLLLKVRE
jgi:hypothetical protein